MTSGVERSGKEGTEIILDLFTYIFGFVFSFVWMQKENTQDSIIAIV